MILHPGVPGNSSSRLKAFKELMLSERAQPGEGPRSLSARVRGGGVEPECPSGGVFRNIVSKAVTSHRFHWRESTPSIENNCEESESKLCFKGL